MVTELEIRTGRIQAYKHQAARWPQGDDHHRTELGISYEYQNIRKAT